MRSEIVGFLALFTVIVALSSCEQPLDPEELAYATGGASKPKPPSGTDAIPMQSDRIDIFWTDNSNNEGSFRVERSTNGGASWVTASVLPPNSVALVDEGRTSEQRVCYRVIATMGRQGGAASAPSPTDCTTPPAAPSGMIAETVDPHIVDLAWKDNSRIEDGYYLTRFTQENQGDETLIAQPPANATSYRDAGLTSGKTYHYRVRAKKDGGFGSHSNIAEAGIPPGPPAPPSGMDAVAFGGGIVTLKWTDNSTDEAEFRLERASSAAGPWEVFRSLPPNYTATTDGQRPMEQPSCYRVVAISSSGNSDPSNVDCATTPAAPSNLAAGMVGESTVDLTWSDNSGVEDGYEVLRNFVAVAVLGANATSYQDVGLVTNATYQYRLRARKQDGFSAYSDPVTVVTASTPPNVPGPLQVMPSSSTSISLSWWDNNSSSEEGFRVERSTTGGATWAAVGTTAPAESGWMWFSDDGQQSEREVCYRVFAFNSKGDSGPSDTDCTAPPIGPTGLSGTPVDDHTIELRWDDNSGVEDSYVIWLSTPEDFYPMETLPPNTRSARVPRYGSAFAYAIAAGRDGGNSDFACCVWADGPSALQATSPLKVQRQIRQLEQKLRAARRNP
jgi:fibronectin type 3 domain-containing protein